MTVLRRLVQGRVLGSDGVSEVSGYATAQVVIGAGAGAVQPLNFIKDLTGNALLTGIARASFGPSVESVVRRREISRMTAAPAPTPLGQRGLWQMELPQTNSAETNPSDFAYLVKVFLASGSLVTQKVITVPVVTGVEPPLDFNQAVDVTPGAPIISSSHGVLLLDSGLSQIPPSTATGTIVYVKA